MKRIIYPVIGRLPSEKAKIIQIIKTSSWIFKKNPSFSLIFPKRKTHSLAYNKNSELMKFYGIDKIPDIEKIPNIDLLNSKFKRFAWYIHIFTYSFFEGN